MALSLSKNVSQFKFLHAVTHVSGYRYSDKHRLKLISLRRLLTRCLFFYIKLYRQPLTHYAFISGQYYLWDTLS